MDIIMWAFVLIAALYFLAASSKMFTQSAEKIGLWLRIPPFVVGVTIVAIGTSLPELVSSIFAVVTGNSEIVVGNVIGSNITNILVILGVSAIVARKIVIKETFLRIDLMVLIASMFMLFLVSFDGTITLIETIILFASFIISIVSIVKAKNDVEPKVVKPLDV